MVVKDGFQAAPVQWRIPVRGVEFTQPSAFWERKNSHVFAAHNVVRFIGFAPPSRCIFGMGILGRTVLVQP